MAVNRRIITVDVRTTNQDTFDGDGAKVLSKGDFEAVAIEAAIEVTDPDNPEVVFEARERHVLGHQDMTPGEITAANNFLATFAKTVASRVRPLNRGTR